MACCPRLRGGFLDLDVFFDFEFEWLPDVGFFGVNFFWVDAANKDGADINSAPPNIQVMTLNRNVPLPEPYCHLVYENGGSTSLPPHKPWLF